MKTLVMYGNENDTELFRLLTTYLKRYTKISTVSSVGIFNNPNGFFVQLFDCNNLSQISAEDTVLYLKQKSNLKSLKFLSSHMTVIVNTGYKRQLEFVSKFRVHAVTYGLSSKDTITFSSRKENEIVLSLQRTVRTIDGIELDPMEIPCRLQHEYNDFTILAFITILIVLNELHLSEDGYLIV